MGQQINECVRFWMVISTMKKNKRFLWNAGWRITNFYRIVKNAPDKVTYDPEIQRKFGITI